MSSRAPTHYCPYCGLDMKAKEERECRDCDGDLCRPTKYVPLNMLRPGHPRLRKEAEIYGRGGCRHRPKCSDWTTHMDKKSR